MRLALQYPEPDKAQHQCPVFAPRRCGPCGREMLALQPAVTRPMMPEPSSGYLPSSATTSRRNSLRSRAGIGRAAACSSASSGPTVFRHVCRMGLEGIVSKRTDAPYRSGPSKTWLKSKNPASEAVRREREEEWR